MAKILVADDNSNIQKMVGLALKDQGIDVVAVGNGEAAVRKISDVRPDLVLADVFMPVRNGYEVCRYVKENSALSRIPVILLVGAFDPLDEQEAQRVGADGVLKKPFVPPDPLISMVKSALARAGVSLRPSAAAEKPEASPHHEGPLGSGSQFGAFSTDNFPEVTTEPIEEFATPREEVKIAAGQEPLAFGNLLETKEEEQEDAPMVSPKPMIEIAKDRGWEDEPADVPEEEQEEDSSHGGWHPEGLQDEAERAAASTKGQADWRDVAFQENSPAKSSAPSRWVAPEPAATVEATALPGASVSAIPSKAGGPVVPFTRDAWAASLAAKVGEKVVEMKDSGAAIPEVEATAQLEEAAAKELPRHWTASQESVQRQAPPAPREMKPEPEKWAAIPESSWEVDAKRASMLASSWDAAVPAAQEKAAEVVAETVQQSAVQSQAPNVHAKEPVEAAEEPVESSAYSGQSELTSERPGLDESLLMEEPTEPTIASSAPEVLENPWEVPSGLKPGVGFEDENEEPAGPAPIEEPGPEAAHAEGYVPAPQAAGEPLATQAAQPNMDELVARVLSKMNPDMLQKVTREILKPVVEALIRDELNAKKS